MKILDFILHAISIISFSIVVIFGVFGVYEQIMGPADAEKLLKRLRFPLSYNQVLLVGFISLGIMFISHLVRMKLSGKM